MRKITLALFAVAAVSFVSSVHAVSISINGGGNLPVGATGQLQVIVDIAPEGTKFTNGGIDLGISTSNPGVIKFTGANVLAPEFFGGFVKRWATTLVNGVANESISLLRGVALNTAGLDNTIAGNPIVDGGTQFLFATVDFEVLGTGMTDVMTGGASGGDSFVNNGVPSTSVQLGSISITGGDVIPEPSTMALAGLSLIGLVLRRRNG